MGLIADEVETAAPRRSGQGSAADVRDWVIRSGIRLTPRQIYSRSNAVVVEQAARWPMPDAGAETDGARKQPTGEQTVFSAFQVRDGRISRLLRSDAVVPALAISGLTGADLTP